MNIPVRLFATLNDYGSDESGRMTLDLPQGSRIRDLIRVLEIPDKTGRVVLVNGRVAGEDRELVPGDQVVLFPPVEGG